MSERMWFFENNSEQQGPVPESQLKSMIESQQLASNTLVWSEHLTEWTPANTLESFALVRTSRSQARSYGNAANDSSDAFNNEQTKAFATNYIAQVREIITNPKGFFEMMPTSGGLANPMVFFAISLGIYLVGTAICSFNIVVPLILVIIFPISVFLGGMLVNFVAMSLGGRGSFEGTLRVYCYSYATLIAAWVPIIGLIASFYSWYLFFLGFKRVHDLDTPRTIAVIVVAGLIAGIVMGLGACGAGLIAIVGAGMMSR